jgi:hypothetical protein
MDRAAAEEEAEAGSQTEQESEADPEAEPNAQDASDDEYVPERTITKAELMAALKTILWCRSENDLADVTDPDVELHDALKEAEDIIRHLRCQVRDNDSVSEAFEEKQRAAKKQKPAIEERPAKLGSRSVAFDDVDDWLEERAEQGKAAATGCPRTNLQHGDRSLRVLELNLETARDPDLRARLTAAIQGVRRNRERYSGDNCEL